MSPELELLDQLLGEPISLSVLARLFDSREDFRTAVRAMLREGDVQLLGHDGIEVPRWQWEAMISGVSDARLQITDQGARRIA